jgi:hypothetical protein
MISPILIYDFSDLDEATDAEVELEIAEIRQGADRLTREAEIQALMKSRLGQTQKSCARLCNVKFHRVVLCLPGHDMDADGFERAATTPEGKVCQASMTATPHSHPRASHRPPQGRASGLGCGSMPGGPSQTSVR